MHTNQTLDIFDDVTVQIGAEFRSFTKNTCAAFNTRELRRESEARKRRKSKKANKRASMNPVPEPSAGPLADRTDDERLPKKFNLQTYKYHSLGDVVNTIRRYGTSDSYSTEPVSN
jgi:hypothetical protein